MVSFFFFFNDTATTEIYTLSLHDALPICNARASRSARKKRWGERPNARHLLAKNNLGRISHERSEEHTSELQSRSDLVCRLLLEKKKGHCETHGTLYHRAQHAHVRSRADR